VQGRDPAVAGGAGAVCSLQSVCFACTLNRNALGQVPALDTADGVGPAVAWASSLGPGRGWRLVLCGAGVDGGPDAGPAEDAARRCVGRGAEADGAVDLGELGAAAGPAECDSAANSDCVPREGR
jgi:hypothetical protein